MDFSGGLNSYSEMFFPDTDGIIPITDDEYFEDDIVTLFVNFIETVYGHDTLEENLQFIANALTANSQRLTAKNLSQN